MPKRHRQETPYIQIGFNLTLIIWISIIVHDVNKRIYVAMHFSGDQGNLLHNAKINTILKIKTLHKLRIAKVTLKVTLSNLENIKKAFTNM